MQDQWKYLIGFAAEFIGEDQSDEQNDNMCSVSDGISVSSVS